jgi:hypothetical protein
MSSLVMMPPFAAGALCVPAPAPPLARSDTAVKVQKRCRANSVDTCDSIK